MIKGLLISSTFHSPIGFVRDRNAFKESEELSNDKEKSEYTSAVMKRAWNIPLAQAKSVPLNFLMLYFFGNSIQIFNIAMIGMMFKGAATSLIFYKKAFRPLDQDVAHIKKKDNKANGFGDVMNQIAEDPFIMQKMAYIGVQLVIVGIVCWKCAKLGLLPTQDSDWLSFAKPKIAGMNSSTLS